jgi:hypothetical protein
MTDTPLTPPAATSTLVLTPPEPVAAVTTTKAGGMVPLDQAALPGLDQKVEQYVADIISLDAHSPAFGAKADDIRAMGDDDVRAAAESSNRLLQAPMRAMSKGDFLSFMVSRNRKARNIPGRYIIIGTDRPAMSLT